MNNKLFCIFKDESDKKYLLCYIFKNQIRDQWVRFKNIKKSYVQRNWLHFCISNIRPQFDHIYRQTYAIAPAIRYRTMQSYPS